GRFSDALSATRSGILEAWTPGSQRGDVGGARPGPRWFGMAEPPRTVLIVVANGGWFPHRGYVQGGQSADGGSLEGEQRGRPKGATSRRISRSTGPLGDQPQSADGGLVRGGPGQSADGGLVRGGQARLADESVKAG